MNTMITDNGVTFKNIEKMCEAETADEYCIQFVV